MIKILAATTKTQGQRKNDFCFVPEGELVNFASECDGEQVDGRCGCRRSMTGLSCHTGTTTMMVIESELTSEEYIAKLLEGYRSAGYGLIIGDKLPEMASLDAQDLFKVAGTFPTGTVIEKRGDTFRARN